MFSGVGLPMTKPQSRSLVTSHHGNGSTCLCKDLPHLDAAKTPLLRVMTCLDAAPPPLDFEAEHEHLCRLICL